MKDSSGIYQILNKDNGKRYIGSSVNLNKRIWGHRHKLQNHKHENKYLQASWDKYSETSFEIKTVLICSPKDLFFYEDLIIKYYKSNQPEFGYNLRAVVESNLGYRSNTYKLGDTYNRLTLIESVGPSKWLYQCICGIKKVGDPYPIRTGRVKSCGCLNKELASALMTKQHADLDWSERNKERSKTTMTKTMSLEANKQLARDHINQINKKRTSNGR